MIQINKLGTLFSKKCVTILFLSIAHHACASDYLTSVTGSPFAVGTGVSSAVYSPDSKWVAANNPGNTAISMYSVDQTTGAIIFLRDTTGINQPSYLSFSPVLSGNYYLSAISRDPLEVHAYSVDAQTGQLTPIGDPASSPTGDNPAGLSYSPNGQWLAVSNYDDNSISIYDVNSSTGVLTQASFSPITPEGLSSPEGNAYSPDSRFFAVSNVTSSNFSIYSVNASTGNLTFLFSSPTLTIPSSGDILCLDIAYSPDGKWLAACGFVSGPDTGAAFVYSVDQTTGAVIPVSGFPFSTGNAPYFLQYSPDSSHLVVTNNDDNTVSAFSVNGATGVLTQVTDSAFATGGEPFGVDYSPNNDWLAVANLLNTISVYKVAPTPTPPATSRDFVYFLQQKYGPLL